MASMTMPRIRILAVETIPPTSACRAFRHRAEFVRRYGVRPSRASLTPSRSAAMAAIAGCRMNGKSLVRPAGRGCHPTYDRGLRRKHRTTARREQPSRPAAPSQCALEEFGFATAHLSTRGSRVPDRFRFGCPGVLRRNVKEKLPCGQGRGGAHVLNYGIAKVGIAA